MDLGWSAITLAAHVSLIVSVFFVFVNAVAVRLHWGPDMPIRVFLPLLEPALFFAAALSVERIYYIAARFLRGLGYDLWTMHPAPDILSVILALSLFWLAAATRRIRSPSPRQAWRVIGLQAMTIIAFATGLALVLV